MQYIYLTRTGDYYLRLKNWDSCLHWALITGGIASKLLSQSKTTMILFGTKLMSCCVHQLQEESGQNVAISSTKLSWFFWDPNFLGFEFTKILWGTWPPHVVPSKEAPLWSHCCRPGRAKEIPVCFAGNGWVAPAFFLPPKSTDRAKV